MKTKHVLLVVDSLCAIQCVCVALFILRDGFQFSDLGVLILSVAFAWLCISYFRTMLHLVQVKTDSQKLDLELSELFREAKDQKNKPESK